ncbi:unnamed protein product, partial [Mesorhabditis spiculigera]
MLYYGDMDAICNPILGLRFSLQIFETIPDYQAYYLANRVAGKWLQNSGCRFATHAGHNVGRDRPEVLQHLFEKFIAGKAPGE